MSKLSDLVLRISAHPDCMVSAAIGQPKTEFAPPSDLTEFYSLCGGLVLFRSKQYWINIVGPGGVVPANPKIVGELCPEDISSRWYIVAEAGSQECLTVDLDPQRLGRCYDSFWDRHGIPGSCKIVAVSFTDLLERLYRNAGEHWYWLRDDFQSLGDAYDVN